MGVNKVLFGEEVLVDLTSDTVAPENLQEGAVAHSKTGNLIRGTANFGGAAPCSVLLASTFDPTASYNVGDYVIYNGTLCRFRRNKAPGNWDGSIAHAVNVSLALKHIAVNSSRVGIFGETEADLFPQYLDLNNIHKNQIMAVGVGGISFVSNYPTRLSYGSTIIDFAYTEDLNSGSIQVAFPYNPLKSDLIAFRACLGNDWNDWSYISLDSCSEDYSKSNLTDGYVVDGETGDIIQTEYTTSYSVTDYFPVSFGQKIKIGYVRGRNMLVGGVIYDEDKNPLFNIGDDKQYTGPGEFVINDHRAAYARVNIVTDSLLARKYNYVIVEDLKYIPDISDVYVISNPQNLYDKYPNYFTKLKDACEYILNYDLHHVRAHVQAGTYDIVDEIGLSFFNGYDGSDRYSYGLKFGNDTHWIFSEGAKVVFDYEGSNVNVANKYSPLVICGSCEIENLNVETTNSQYCIHDDWPYRESNWVVKYIDCKMKHNGNTLGDFDTPTCIGGGLLPDELVEIKGGHYTSPALFNAPISYHSLWTTSATVSKPSKIIFDRVWLSGSIRLQDGPTDKNPVDVFITNCSQGADIVGTHTYFTITEWNNIIRD